MLEERTNGLDGARRDFLGLVWIKYLGDVDRGNREKNLRKHISGMYFWWLYRTSIMVSVGVMGVVSAL